jgi:hypothetical protein
MKFIRLIWGCLIFYSSIQCYDFTNKDSESFLNDKSNDVASLTNRQATDKQIILQRQEQAWQRRQENIIEKKISVLRNINTFLGWAIGISALIIAFIFLYNLNNNNIYEPFLLKPQALIPNKFSMFSKEYNKDLQAPTKAPVISSNKTNEAQQDFVKAINQINNTSLPTDREPVGLFQLSTTANTILDGLIPKNFKKK